MEAGLRLPTPPLVHVMVPVGDAPVTVAVHFEAEPTVTGDGEQLTAIEL